MMRAAVRVWVPVVAAMMAAAGCEKAPTAPEEVVTQTTTFSGTLAPSGTVNHFFTIPQQGAVRITLVFVAPEEPEAPYEPPTGTDAPPAAEDGPPKGIPPHTDDPPAVEDQPPTPRIFIGVGIGTWNGSACTVVAQRTDATLSTVISGTALAGQFCVSIFDPGTVAEPVAYIVHVEHP